MIFFLLDVAFDVFKEGFINELGEPIPQYRRFPWNLTTSQRIPFAFSPEGARFLPDEGQHAFEIHAGRKQGCDGVPEKLQKGNSRNAFFAYFLSIKFDECCLVLGVSISLH